MGYDTDGTRAHLATVALEADGTWCCGRPVADSLHQPAELKAAAGSKRPGSMPDDSYPINSAAELDKAIKAFGRGLGDNPADQKRKAAIRRHIIARAKALGLTDKLPDGWTSSSGSKEAPKVDARQRKPRRNDFVEWVDAQGKVSGKVEKLVSSGKVPDVDTAGGSGDVEGTPGDPAARVRIYRKDPEGEWQETETAVARKLSSLRKIDPLVKDAKQIAVEQEWRRRTGGQFAPTIGPLGRRPIPPPGFAVPTSPLQSKLAPSAVAETGVPDGAVVADEGNGVLDVIVSVTGVVDDVDDIIEPGAYTKTLDDRTPKVLADHDWSRKVGRCESIEELLPGDPRLPKTTPNGKPWPREAGALIAKVRFNLETEEGRTAYSECKFYGLDPKSGAQFSIGYNVPPGEAWKDGNGIRHIKRLDLYEVSSVLWGAHSLTGLVPSQEAKGLDDQPVELETKRLPVGMSTTADGKPAGAKVAADQEADDENGYEAGDIIPSAPSLGTDFDYEDDLTEDPTDWPQPHFPVWDGKDDGENIGCRCGADETDPQAHGLDLSGDLDPDELAELHTALADDVHQEVDRFLSLAVKRYEARTETKAAPKCRYCTEDATHHVTDSNGGPGAFVHNGHRQMAERAIRRRGGKPTTKPIGESKAAGVEATPGDVRSTEKLRLYWVHGAGAAKIRWGEPNDWKRCVRELSKHLGDRAKGYCTLRHHEALGVYPGQEDPHHSHGPRGGSKTAQVASGEDAPTTEEKSLMSGRTWFPGSMEALQAAVEDAIEDAHLPADEDSGNGMMAAGWVNVFATWNDHCYVTIYGPGHGDDGDTFDIQFTATPDGDGDYTVTLGESKPIEIVGVAVPDTDDDDAASSSATTSGPPATPPGVPPVVPKAAGEGETKDAPATAEAKDLSDTPEGRALANAALLAVSS